MHKLEIQRDVVEGHIDIGDGRSGLNVQEDLTSILENVAGRNHARFASGKKNKVLLDRCEY